jgi:uncharacterized protein (TIGR00369 family)
VKAVAAADPRNVFAAVPFMGLLGVQRAFSEAGHARLVLPARADLGNVIGAMHGGAVLTLLDVVMASAAVSRIAFTRTAVTLSLDSCFLTPGRGTLTADGEVTAHDADIAHCRATVTDAAGQLVAQALGCFRYLPFPTQDTREDNVQGDTP